VTWIKIKSKPGDPRNAGLYAGLTQRAEHLLDNYLPAIGGISIGSYYTTQTTAYDTCARVMITPVDCRFELLIYATVDGGTGTIKCTYDGSSVTQTLTSTSIDLYSMGVWTGTGDPEFATIEGKVDSGARTLKIYGAFFRPKSGSPYTGLGTLPTKPSSILAGGYALSAELVRRLKNSPAAIIKGRRPALSYFAMTDSSDRSKTFLVSDELELFGAYQLADFAQVAQFKLSFIAPVGTVGFLKAGSDYETATSADANVIYTTSAIDAGNFFLNLGFVDASGVPASVESWVVYED